MVKHFRIQLTTGDSLVTRGGEVKENKSTSDPWPDHPMVIKVTGPNTAEIEDEVPAPLVYVQGTEAISFLERVPAGYYHNLIIFSPYLPDKRGYTCIYTRYGAGDHDALTERYIGIAYPLFITDDPEIKSVLWGGKNILVLGPPGYSEIKPESIEYKNRIWVQDSQNVKVLAFFEKNINDGLTISAAASSEHGEITEEGFAALVEKYRAIMATGLSHEEYKKFFERYREYFSGRSGATFDLPKMTFLGMAYRDDSSAISQTIKLDSWKEANGNTRQDLELETEILVLIKNKIISADFVRKLRKESDGADALQQARQWLVSFQAANVK